MDCCVAQEMNSGARRSGARAKCSGALFFLSLAAIYLTSHCMALFVFYWPLPKLDENAIKKMGELLFPMEKGKKELPRLCRPSGGKFSFPAALMPTLFAATNKTHFISSLSPPPSFFESARLLDLSFLILLTLID